MQNLPGLKYLFIGFISFCSFISSENSFAQSIVGKWNQVTVKQWLTDEGAKKYGKPFIVTDMATIGTVVSEFKSDHTYVTTSGNSDGGSRTYSGSWSLDGNILTMTDQKVTAAVQSTVTIKSDMLVMETLHSDSKITRKIEITFKRG
ncbi:MAG TPA: lipocalin family protein [Puia sp.]|nr:lipocalin family protein [Puia sp.]